VLRRRARARGAAALVLTGSMSLVVSGGVTAVDAAAAVSAQAHAEAAADAVAHGTGAALLTDANREQLSIDVQAGAPCDTDVRDTSAAGPGCAAAIAAARTLATQNGAVLRRLVVGPDPRDMREGVGAGRLLVEAYVFVPRRLPVYPATCPPQPGSGADLCWVDAWSAAQGAG